MAIKLVLFSQNATMVIDIPKENPPPLSIVISALAPNFYVPIYNLFKVIHKL
jgi:hypothetical protein